MIDPKNVTFSAGNIHIPNSYQYKRGEVTDFLNAARPAHPDCLPLQKRGNGSLLREWATHKAAYLLDYKRERTASVDLNYPQRWWVKVLYFVRLYRSTNRIRKRGIYMRTTKTFIAALALLLIAAAGCSVIRPGVPVELPQIVHDTVYHTTVQRDTIREVRHFKDTVIQRDSVFVKGETVYREKYIYKTRTAHDTVQVYRYLRDTLFIHQRDSISVPVYIDRVEKVKYTPGIVKTLAWVGGLCCLAAILWLLFLLVKRKF